MKIRIGDTVLLVLSLMLVIFITECGYRIFLSGKVEQDRERFNKPESNPSFGFWGYPSPWMFDLNFGSKYSDGHWASGSIVKGAFASCGKEEGPGNKYGNYGVSIGDFSKADLKIALFGTSYTMMDGAGKGVATGRGENTMTNLLQEELAKRLGKSVHILNFSRDSTGILTMFDIAKFVARDYKPDLLLFTFNTAALGYRRYWRIVKEVRPGFYRMYHSLDPSEILDPMRSMVHITPITKLFTPAWCADMLAAKRLGDEKRLRNDPLVRELIAEYRGIMRERNVPRVIVNFWSFQISFVYNYLKFKDPFHGIEIFSSNTIWAPLELSSYSRDQEFIEAVSLIKESKVPFHMIHIPTFQEMRAYSKTDRNYEPPKLTENTVQLIAFGSIAKLTGKKILNLLDYYPAEALSDPLKLVNGENDSHPNGEGVRAMADAMFKVLNDQVPMFRLQLPMGNPERLKQ